MIEQISARAKKALLAQLPVTELSAPRHFNAVSELKTDPDLLANFLTAAAANKFHVQHCSAAELCATVTRVLAQLEVKTLLCSSDLPLAPDTLGVPAITYDRPIEELRDTVFSADVALCMGTAGVASLGNVMCVSAPDAPRFLTLAPPRLVLLLPAARIVASYEDALQLVPAPYPANVVFTAGPSRTADIELITIFGAHGPHTVELIVYGEEQ